MKISLKKKVESCDRSSEKRFAVSLVVSRRCGSPKREQEIASLEKRRGWGKERLFAICFVLAVLSFSIHLASPFGLSLRAYLSFYTRIGAIAVYKRAQRGVYNGGRRKGRSGGAARTLGLAGVLQQSDIDSIVCREYRPLALFYNFSPDTVPFFKIFISWFRAHISRRIAVNPHRNSDIVTRKSHPPNLGSSRRREIGEPVPRHCRIWWTSRLDSNISSLLLDPMNNFFIRFYSVSDFSREFIGNFVSPRFFKEWWLQAIL